MSQILTKNKNKNVDIYISEHDAFLITSNYL